MGKPRTISTSFISGTGFMKCMPMTRSARPDAAANLVIEIDEVFDAKMASGRTKQAQAGKNIELEGFRFGCGLDDEVAGLKRAMTLPRGYVRGGGAGKLRG